MSVVGLKSLLVRTRSRKVRRPNASNDFNDEADNIEDVDGQAIEFWVA